MASLEISADTESIMENKQIDDPGRGLGWGRNRGLISDYYTLMRSGVIPSYPLHT